MPATKSFNPATDISPLTDQVVLVTGGTAGLGRGTVLALAQHAPAEIIFSGRNKTKASALIEEAQKVGPGVRFTFLECDLASLASVHAAANRFLETATRLDVLMCNAGIMATGPGVSPDNYEIQFATNHLGHALLIKKLLPLLKRSPEPRIVNLSSTAYAMTPINGINFKTLKSDQASAGLHIPSIAVWVRYGQSKLANLLYARALANHHPDVTSVAVHPGIIKTGLFEGVSAAASPFAAVITLFSHTTPVEEGHYNQVWAATCSKGMLENGAYYEPVGRKIKPSSKHAKDAKLTERLWQWTEDALKDYE